MLTRAQRRAHSRDAARAWPVPPRRPSYGAVARAVHARRPMAVQPPSPQSGQERINAKRDARASFWLGRTTLYAEAKGGRLRLTKCGGRTLILADDARAFLDSLREAA